MGCAVLTGALLVGDSLQGSLRAQSARRLGWVSRSLVAPRFFRDSLPRLLAEKGAGRAAPVLLLQADRLAPGRRAGARRHDSWAWSRRSSPRRAASIRPGCRRPWPVPWRRSRATRSRCTCRSRARSRARRDWARRRPRPETGPSRRAACWRPPDEGDAFSLRPRLEAPRNLFVPLADLQEQLGLKGRCNAIVADGPREELQAALEASLALDDWGLGAAFAGEPGARPGGEVRHRPRRQAVLRRVGSSRGRKARRCRATPASWRICSPPAKKARPQRGGLPQGLRQGPSLPQPGEQYPAAVPGHRPDGAGSGQGREDPGRADHRLPVPAGGGRAEAGRGGGRPRSRPPPRRWDRSCPGA